MGGWGNKLNPLTITPINKIENVVDEYYIYKKSNFKQLLEDCWKINNQLTEERLLRSDLCEYDYYNGYKYNKICTYMTNFMTNNELVRKSRPIKLLGLTNIHLNWRYWYLYYA